MKILRILAFWFSGVAALVTAVTLALGQPTIAIVFSYVVLASFILGLLSEIQIKNDLIEH